jgi:fucose permease
MNATTHDGIHRKRLFAGICLALIPTGAQFALIANVLGQFKAEFLLTNAQVGMIAGIGIGAMTISLLLLGPFLEKFGMRAGTFAAFFGHLIGLTLVLSAVALRGDPSGFYLLMLGAGCLAVGNGMIEVAGNPLTTALYPDQKTTKLNLFHAFFPIGILSGSLIGWGLNNLQGVVPFMYHWTFQLGIIYIPIIIYGIMVLPQKFPKTEYGESGLPFSEMFRYTFTHPLMYLMMLMLGLAMCVELGSGRWIPAIFAQAGFGAWSILLLAWISVVMIVLRLFASHFVERLSPPGMLFFAGLVTGISLLLFAAAEGFVMAILAATCFGLGVAFFFPTIVGLVAERMPRAGSLGIVLTMGVGLGAAGFIGTPVIGRIIDIQMARQLDQEKRTETAAVLKEAEVVFYDELQEISGLTPEELLERGMVFRPEDFERALPVIRAAIEDYAARGEQVAGTAVPVALREISGFQGVDEVVGRAEALLGPAEAWGGQRALLLISPIVLIIMAVFGVMYLNDRRRGGYKAERLDKTMEKLAETAGQPIPSPDKEK